MKEESFKSNKYLTDNKNELNKRFTKYVSKLETLKEKLELLYSSKC